MSEAAPQQESMGSLPKVDTSVPHLQIVPELPDYTSIVEDRLLSAHIDVSAVRGAEWFKAALIVGRSIVEMAKTQIATQDPETPPDAPRQLILSGSPEARLKRLEEKIGADMNSNSSLRRERAHKERARLGGLALAHSFEYPEVRLSAEIREEWGNKKNFGAAESVSLLIASYGHRIENVLLARRQQDMARARRSEYSNRVRIPGNIPDEYL